MNKNLQTQQRLSDLLEAIYSVVNIDDDGTWTFVGDANELKNAYFEAETHLLSFSEGECQTPGIEERPIGAGVTRILLNGAANITVRQGAVPQMKLMANTPGDLSKITTHVIGDCLTIDTERSTLSHIIGGLTQQFNGPVGNFIQSGSHPGHRIELTLPSLSGIHIAGAGNVDYQGVAQRELKLKVSGAGNITVTGATGRLEGVVSGAGGIAAYDLEAIHGDLRVSGAGDIKATIRNSVLARVSGVGKIKIQGNPPERDTNVSGLGKIKFI